MKTVLKTVLKFYAMLMVIPLVIGTGVFLFQMIFVVPGAVERAENDKRREKENEQTSQLVSENRDGVHERVALLSEWNASHDACTIQSPSIQIDPQRTLYVDRDAFDEYQNAIDSGHYFLRGEPAVPIDYDLKLILNATGIKRATPAELKQSIDRILGDYVIFIRSEITQEPAYVFDQDGSSYDGGLIEYSGCILRVPEMEFVGGIVGECENSDSVSFTYMESDDESMTVVNPKSTLRDDLNSNLIKAVKKQMSQYWTEDESR